MKKIKKGWIGVISMLLLAAMLPNRAAAISVIVQESGSAIPEELCVGEKMKYMKEQKSGVIVNFGSVTGEEGDKWGLDYAVAKSGVMGGLTKSLALYGADYGVRCCCVSPGPIMTRPNMAGMTTLLRHAGQLDDIVNMVLYLCSDYGKFITGTNYFVDGGRTICPDKTWGKNDV